MKKQRELTPLISLYGCMILAKLSEREFFIHFWLGLSIAWLAIYLYWTFKK